MIFGLVRSGKSVECEKSKRFDIIMNFCQIILRKKVINTFDFESLKLLSDDK